MHGLVVISFILIAIVAGMFLLAKTKKEELGLFFKVVSYIVIAVGFAALICLAVRCFCGTCHNGSKSCTKSEQCYRSEQCHKGSKKCKSVKQCNNKKKCCASKEKCATTTCDHEKMKEHSTKKDSLQ